MGEKDKTVRGAFRNKHLFLEFIRKYIPQLKNTNISEENLEWIDPNTITPDLSEKSGDVFYKVAIESEDIYVYISLEHKSSVEYDTVIQTMFYTFRIWEQEYKKAGKKGENKNYKLPTVLMVLFYEGEEKWTAPLNFKEKINMIEGYNPFELNIIDLKQLPEEELLKSREAIDYFILLRKPDIEDKTIKDIVNRGKEMLSEEEWGVFVEFLYSKVREEYGEEEIEKLRAKRGGEEIMGLLEKAFYEAEEKGIEKGIEKEKYNIALSMLENGMSIEMVEKITGLKREKIEEIAKEAKHN